MTLRNHTKTPPKKQFSRTHIAVTSPFSNTNFTPKKNFSQTEKKKQIQFAKSEPTEEFTESDSIAVNFFNHHPEANIDIRPIDEKIQDIDTLLMESQIDDENLLELLMQKKALCEIFYGENSVDAIIASIQLGSFYNKVHKFQSAYRHLNIAYDISSQYTQKLNIHDQLRLSVEYVQTLIELGFTSESLPSENDSNTSHSSAKEFIFDDDYKFELDEDKLNIAENALFPYKNVENTDNDENKLDLFYRRDLYIAQMKLCRRKFEKSLKYYLRAIPIYEKMIAQGNKNANEIELAALFLNCGLVAREIKHKNLALSYFQKAQKIFSDYDLDFKVKEITNYLRSLEEKVIAQEDGTDDANS